jgi:exonuclease III
MSKFDFVFNDYFTFGSSAMSTSVDLGVLYGRPFGGTVIMINNRWRQNTRSISAAERFVVIKMNKYLFINLYLPCAGTPDRLLIIEEVFSQIKPCLSSYSDCKIVIGGDFNCDLDSRDPAADMISGFLQNMNLQRCDLAAGCTKTFTYCSDALGRCSCIDFVLMSDVAELCSYRVLETGTNLSDHLPIMIEFNCEVEHCDKKSAVDSKQQHFYGGIRLI